MIFCAMRVVSQVVSWPSTMGIPPAEVIVGTSLTVVYRESALSCHLLRRARAVDACLCCGRSTACFPQRRVVLEGQGHRLLQG